MVAKIRNRSHWVDLPHELLDEVMESLSLSDQIRLRLACKSWLQRPLHEGRRGDRLPWVVSYDKGFHNDDICTFKLFDPIHENPYLIQHITESYEFLYHPNFVSSKDGWLLFLKEKGISGYASVFLFCPFTAEIIVLPDLCHGIQDGSQRIVAFSSVPNSPDCVFLALHYDYDGGRVTTSTYRHGDKAWISHEFNELMPNIASILFYQGDFYCVSRGGNLAVYRVSHQKWYSLRGTASLPIHCVDNFLVVSKEEDLLLVCLDTFDICFEFSLFKFDFSRMKWIQKSRLEDQALFLGERSGHNSFAIPAFGDTAALANKIFYCDLQNKTWFIDLDDVKVHDCKGTQFDSLSVGKERYDRGIWIEPTRHKAKNLHSSESVVKNLAECNSALDLMFATRPRKLKIICPTTA